MKYCIECGNQLVDEAKFCNKCGAKQPLREEKKEEVEAPKPQDAKVESKPKEESIVDAPKEEAKVIAPIPALKEEAPAIEAKPKVEATNKVLSLEDEEYKSKAPAERYRYLMEHDLDFQTVVKASKKRDLMSLSNILYLVVVIVCTFIPYLVFTGNYAHHAGLQILAEEGKSIPHKFGGLELFSYHVTAGNYALAPNSNVTGIYPFVVFLFTFLFLAVMILAAFLGSTKGYRLKEYEKGGIKGLIKGLGVSLSDPLDKHLDQIMEFPNAILHTVAGILSPEDVNILKNKNIKLLILGYKQKGRGVDYYSQEIKDNIETLKNLLPSMLDNKWFNLISFDNLALEQLAVKNLLSEEEWERTYMGDEATFTFFIDLVNETFAGNSLTAETFPIKDWDAIRMFQTIQKK